MSSKKTLGSAALATAAAAMFMAAPVMAGTHHDGANMSKGHCMGVNACKGKSSCKTAGNACKGQNGCKGQGFVETSAQTCDQLGGKFMMSSQKSMHKDMMDKDGSMDDAS